MSKYKKGTKLWYEREANEQTFLDWYHSQDKQTYEKPSVTVDFIGLRFNTTVDKLQVMLVKRIANPYRGKWALPGGFVEPGENTYQAVQREVKEETNIDLDEERIQLLPLVSTPGRDPRMWVMTNPNIVLLNDDDPLKFKAGDDATEVKFFNVHLNRDNELIFDDLSVNDLAFDHAELLKNALVKLQIEVERKRCYNFVPLLPKRFTGVQLLKLLQAINYKKFKNYTTPAVLDYVKADINLKRTGLKSSSHGRPSTVFELKEE